MKDREVFALDYQTQESISTDELSSLIFKILKRNLSKLDLYISYCRGSLESIKAFEILRGPGRACETISPKFDKKFAQAVQKLRDNGLIMQDPDQSHNQYCVILTEKGEATGQDSFILSVTQFDEIVKMIEGSNGNLDEVAKVYLKEAHDTLKSDFLISSAICLGAASERYISLLSESINTFLNDPDVNKKYSKSDKAKYRISFILENIKSIKDKFANQDNLFRDLDSKIFLLGTIYRLTRNDAGHPDFKPNICKEDLGLSLKASIGYFSNIIKLINLLKP